ncbi:MAG: hypothetical protein IJW37_07040 [Lachnospiraceae bacterium]|nr:hypothetical protein [Lachnospiraceae bacterium]
MNGVVLRESLTMICVGGWLLLQCLHIIVREEMRMSLLCVLGKLLLTAGFLLLYPHPVWTLLFFFAFYPKEERDGISLRLLGIQVLLPVVATVLCVLKQEPGTQIIAVLSVALAAALFAVVEYGIRSILLKNRLLYRQMEKAALNELKVKNLNREISVRSQVAERNARLEEREHIARNIHNVVGHTITSALVSLQAYEVLKEAEPVRAEGKLAATSERMHLALEEIRRAVRVLDAETEEIGLHDFCRLLAAEAEKFSMDTELKILHNFSEGAEKDILIEKRTCEFLHSVLTECLNNGIRHGGATEFFAYLTFDTAHIKLSVSDDGRGFGSLSPVEQAKRLEQGYGLRKMKEYTETHGGAFRLDTENGFKVQVELPLAKEEERTGGQ